VASISPPVSQSASQSIRRSRKQYSTRILNPDSQILKPSQQAKNPPAWCHACLTPHCVGRKCKQERMGVRGCRCRVCMYVRLLLLSVCMYVYREYRPPCEKLHPQPPHDPSSSCTRAYVCLPCKSDQIGSDQIRSNQSRGDQGPRDLFIPPSLE